MPCWSRRRPVRGRPSRRGIQLDRDEVGVPRRRWRGNDRFPGRTWRDRRDVGRDGRANEMWSVPMARRDRSSSREAPSTGPTTRESARHEPGGRRSRVLMLSPDVDTIATDGKRLVYSAIDQLRLRDLTSGDSRPIATLESRYQDYPHIVVTPRAIYWGMVHVRGNARLPEQDTLWSLALEPGDRPFGSRVSISSMASVSDLPVKSSGSTADKGRHTTRPARTRAVTRLMQAGGPLAEVHARPTHPSSRPTRASPSRPT